MVLAISYGIALIFPILFLLALRKFDLYQTGKINLNILTLICGVVAYYLAVQVNEGVSRAGLVTSWEQVVRFTAPIAEEILKSIILIYLVSRADFNYVVDGAIYGFGVGIGFAMVENIQYIDNFAEKALLVAVFRVFSTNLMHATSSGLIGTALAYRRGDATWKSWAVILAGYPIAIGVHMAFNNMVNSGVQLVFAIAFGVTGTALIWYIIKRGLNVQKDWVAEKLGIADRATQEETKVVSNIETVNEVLTPVAKRFGDEKASLVRSLIYKQAEIGIKRKLLETTPSENRKKEIIAIIEGLVEETNVLRTRIGAYCMMMVREVYLGQSTQVWNLLNARIAAAGLGQKGGGLWDRVTSRMSNSSASQEEKS
ncbi:MAG TPA: PrsW family glutamic-type intramembrane protease [Anaerolineales bacterium]|nr:PrsW family glutamic-type intramembrane protease [Anaerolineales bacterium]